MPRQARIKCEFSVYHIILRGNERRNIFLRNKDRIRFIETLVKAKKKYNCFIYAYCLMSNHVHLIISDNGNDISTIVKSIATSYAIYFNRVYRRSGHLFQDRFRSELIEDDKYLLQASRYIHNNPVKAGMVNSATDYKWSSYQYYNGKPTSHPDAVDTGKVLKIISDNQPNAVRDYIHYITQSQATEDIVMDIDEEPTRIEQNTEYIQTLEAAGKRINELLRKRNLSYRELVSNRKARDEVICKIRKNSSLTLREIGFIFKLSESAVCKILNRE